MLTKPLLDKIAFLHDRVGNHEWSGELITREEGDINDLDEWKITAEDIFLADIGTGMYTEYTVDKGGFKAADVIELYEAFPGLETGELKAHHIHTHCVAGVFFSGTDWEQMNDRALVSNYLLMLIVNMKGEAIAKIGFRAKREGGNKTTLSFVNNSDGYKPMTLGKDKDGDEVIVIMDCKIVMENSVDVPAEFSARYERVKQAIDDEAKKEAEERAKKWEGKRGDYSAQKQLPFRDKEWTPSEDWHSELPWNQYTPNGDWKNEWEEGENGVWRKKEKKISDMSDKEFQKFEEQEEARKTFMKDQGANIVFEEKHAKAILNSIESGTYRMDDESDFREQLVAINRELKGQEEMETWTDMWQDMLQEHFDIIYPHATVEKYGELMNVLYEYLKPFKYIRIVQEMLEAIKNEMEMSYHTLIPV